MDIQVIFDGRRWSVDPDPAIVVAGTSIRWVVLGCNLRVARLRWTVHFDHGTPFNRQETKFTSTTAGEAREGTATGQKGEVEGGVAAEPGSYKYGVKIENLETEETMDECDPYLVVQ